MTCDHGLLEKQLKRAAELIEQLADHVYMMAGMSGLPGKDIPVEIREDARRLAVAVESGLEPGWFGEDPK